MGEAGRGAVGLPQVVGQTGTEQIRSAIVTAAAGADLSSQTKCNTSGAGPATLASRRGEWNGRTDAAKTQAERICTFRRTLVHQLLELSVP